MDRGESWSFTPEQETPEETGQLQEGHVFVGSDTLDMDRTVGRGR